MKEKMMKKYEKTKKLYLTISNRCIGYYNIDCIGIFGNQNNWHICGRV